MKKNWSTIDKKTCNIIKATPSIINFDIIKFCKKLGYTDIIESDNEDYMLCMPNTRKHNDNMVIINKVSTISLKGHDLKGWNLFKLQKPRWIKN